MAEVRAVIASVAGTFTEFADHESGPDGDGPLSWTGYAHSLTAARERSGEQESAVCGLAKIGDAEAVLIAFDFRFVGGSIGGRTGTRVVHAFEQAIAFGLPVVSLIATGGSRMQEGMVSLRQLQRISRQAVLLRRAGLAHISLLRHPTTRGGGGALGSRAGGGPRGPGAPVGFARGPGRPAR